MGQESGQEKEVKEIKELSVYIVGTNFLAALM
jgi:hypothetical protein